MLEKIGFLQALEIILDNVGPVGEEEMGLTGLTGRTLAQDAVARVDSPSVDASLKDGYAVVSADIASAGRDNPVRLKLAGLSVAGQRPGQVLEPGTAVRVTTGAPLPPGAEAVLAGEYATEDGDELICTRDSEPGRNVLLRGTDVRSGEAIAQKGENLHPALIGLLAAAGLDRVRVYSRPRVALIGTGDEVVAPGRPLPPGRLYASNIVESTAWLEAFGLSRIETRVAPDQARVIAGCIEEVIGQVDAIVTSGGAWGSERDLMLGLLDSLGWQGFFHRVRLGPGKAAGFGLLSGKPFFILPGGPPSHEAAFLLLALPGLLAMCGRRGPVFPPLKAVLADEVRGQGNWTQVVHVFLSATEDGWEARPIKNASRLSSMAGKDALLLIPEGAESLPLGAMVDVLPLKTLNGF